MVECKQKTGAVKFITIIPSPSKRMIEKWGYDEALLRTSRNLKNRINKIINEKRRSKKTAK